MNYVYAQKMLSKRLIKTNKDENISMTLMIKLAKSGLVSLFNGISSFLGYLMPKLSL